jgi:hypothetical protein
MSDHVTQLHEKVERLHREFKDMASQPPYEELLKIIHRPGWTTPAEVALVSGVVDGLQRQVAAMRLTHEELLAGSRQVGAATHARA